jgi:hypothetical protein
MTFVCRPLERKSGGNDEENVASAHASCCLCSVDQTVRSPRIRLTVSEMFRILRME